ncbi:MAG: thioredoxin [Candidatus Hydrogenedentota bacterium]
MNSPIQTWSQSDFRARIGDGIVLVEFFAVWCTHSEAQRTILNRIAAGTHWGVIVARVDVEAAPAIAAQHAVRDVPTLVLFVDGVEHDRLIGLQSERTLRHFLGDFASESFGTYDRCPGNQ